MKMNEFIEKFNGEDFDLETVLEVKKYIPVMDKRKLAVDVISECTDDIDDFITVDRFKMGIYFDMRVLGSYTNLEVASDFYGMVEQYDALCENGAMYKIVDLFKVDYEASRTVLKSQLEELLEQNSLDAQVVNIAHKINKAIDFIGEKLNDLDISALLPEGMDINEMRKTLDMMK